MRDDDDDAVEIEMMARTTNTTVRKALLDDYQTLVPMVYPLPPPPPQVSLAFYMQ